MPVLCYVLMAKTLQHKCAPSMVALCLHLYVLLCDNSDGRISCLNLGSSKLDFLFINMNNVLDNRSAELIIFVVTSNHLPKSPIMSNLLTGSL